MKASGKHRSAAPSVSCARSESATQFNAASMSPKIQRSGPRPILVRSSSTCECPETDSVLRLRRPNPTSVSPLASALFGSTCTSDLNEGSRVKSAVPALVRPRSAIHVERRIAALPLTTSLGHNLPRTPYGHNWKSACALRRVRPE